MNTYATVVLAAGNGTRMRSILPKVLHSLAGLPLLAHVLNAVDAIPATPLLAPFAATLTTFRPIVVLGHQAEQVESIFGNRCIYTLQREQLGTAHALLAAQDTVDSLNPLPDIVLVCYGDTPLISSELLARVLMKHIESRATITFLTAISDEPTDYGRVVRDTHDRVREIVELRRATEEQLRIREVNSGVYCFDRKWLWPALEMLPRNAAGEFFLTDLIARASAQGREIVTVSGPLDETMGINDRVQLATAEQLLRRRILERHMYAGVTIIDPTTTYISDEVVIGSDTIILPGTMITGKTHIGSECRIGPYSTIDSSTIGDRCVIRNSVLEETTFEDEVSIGPFSHCRPGTHLARGVRMGNFGEVKNSYIGAETDMHHFSYIGDATVGTHVNIGAGVVTVNYDGVHKHPTVIGDRAFVGCDSMLIAPVTIGEQAQTGAGAVVNKDVPPGALVVGVPARVIRRVASRQAEDTPAESSTTESGKKE